MTIGVIIAGCIAILIPPLLARYLYDCTDALESGFAVQWLVDTDGKRFINFLTRIYMTGYLRDYLVYIFAFFIVVVGGRLVLNWFFSFDFSNDAPITINEYMIVFVMIVAAISILFVRSRMTAIILNGVLGYSIAIFLCRIPCTGFGFDTNYRRNSDDCFISALLLFLT